MLDNKLPDVKNLIFALSDIMSVTGFERRGGDRLRDILLPYFDSYECDAAGNHVFVKKSAKNTGKKILLDAHFDEVGMVVSKIHDGGFLSVAFVGGIDCGILPACEVKIYGEEILYGVVCSTPPHLQKQGDFKRLPDERDIRIDTGYEREELEKLAPVGTPVGFYSKCRELPGGRIAGRGLDDKCCGAAITLAAALCDREKMEADIYFTFSVREEIGGAGPCLASFKIKPDAAICADVGFARTPGTKDSETLEYKKGPGIVLTSTGSRRLSRRIIGIAKESGIPLGITVEATDNGTNAAMLHLALDGIPCVSVGVPIGNMHTYNESLDISDVENLALLISKAVCDREFFEADNF